MQFLYIKNPKILIKDYSPIRLVPIFGKIFDRIVYNSLFSYYLSNNLFMSSQSGFVPGDPCITQLQFKVLRC